MSGRFEILVRDRATSRLERERVFAESFLFWLYNTGAGRVARTPLFRRRWASRLYGALQRRPASRGRIAGFVEAMNIDMSESLRRPDEFESFADFFTREIDLARRPIDLDPATCVAPCDGRMLAYQAVEPRQSFRIKRHLFDLERCLGDAALARRFAGGSLTVSRLALRDYHHFHFPVAGVAGQPRAIPGGYDAGGPYSLRRLIPFFSENFRMVTTIESERFGLVAMIEVGALTVGAIVQRCAPGVRVEKGARKGWFDLGGSTIAMLFEPGVITLDADLLDGTSREIETLVRMGERIGTAGRA
jgi:phosphatidylserine decarboxylase